MKRKSRVISFSLLYIFLSVLNVFSGELDRSKPEDVGMSSDRLSRIDIMLKNIADKNTAKGAVAAVTRHGRLVYLKAIGEMDEEKPMQEDTIFRICSQTKLVTSVAVMMLYEEGRFNLNEPISKYIPEFKDTMVLIEDSTAIDGYKLVHPNREITIRDLLAHTSGISYAFWGRPFISEWYLKAGVSDGLYATPGTISDNIKKLAQCPLLFHPGDRYEYGLNIDVLGYFVEIISGMPLDQFFQKRIFEPLGMQDTFFFLPENKISRLAAVYGYDEHGGLRKIHGKIVGPGFLNSKINSNIYDPTYPYQGPRTCFFGGAGLSSTAYDYMLLCQMLLNGGKLNGARLLSRLTVELMTRNHAGDKYIWLTGEGWRVGLGGTTLYDRDQRGYIMPNGTFHWAGYFATDFDIDFENDMTYVLFSQRTPDQNYQAEEFDILRVLTHAAIITE